MARIVCVTIHNGSDRGPILHDDYAIVADSGSGGQATRDAFEPDDVSNRAQLRLETITFPRIDATGRPILEEAIDREIAGGGF